MCLLFSLSGALCSSVGTATGIELYMRDGIAEAHMASEKRFITFVHHEVLCEHVDNVALMGSQLTNKGFKEGEPKLKSRLEVEALSVAVC